MEIIKKFGLETSLFLFQIANFLIVVFILKKFLFKPLKRTLDERKRRIEQSLKDAEDAKIALENAGEERKKILAGAKNDADALTAFTKTSLEEIKEKAAREAKMRSEQIVEEAKQKAAAEFEKMGREVGNISADLSGKIISKAFTGLFTEEEKQKLLARALERIEKGGYEKSPN